MVGVNAGQNRYNLLRKSYIVYIFFLTEGLNEKRAQALAKDMKA